MEEWDSSTDEESEFKTCRRYIVEERTKDSDADDEEKEIMN